MVAGLVVTPAAWLIMGSGVKLDFSKPFEFLTVAFLVALFSSAGDWRWVAAWGRRRSA